MSRQLAWQRLSELAPPQPVRGRVGACGRMGRLLTRLAMASDSCASLSARVGVCLSVPTPERASPCRNEEKTRRTLAVVYDKCGSSVCARNRVREIHIHVASRNAQTTHIRQEQLAKQVDVFRVIARPMRLASYATTAPLG